MREVKHIDNIPFYLYRISRTKKNAAAVAEGLRRKGYYARVSKTSRGYEVWVSANPRWFYKLSRLKISD